MTKLTRSKERVAALGEVFTPDHIVDDMHKLIPDESWANPSMIYLEPTCGNGQFVVKAVEKKIEAGLSPIDSCNTVFGMDIMVDNIEECRKRVWDLVKYQVPQAYRDRLRAIIINNIFQVKDSLDYIKTGKWEEKKFFDNDPTECGNQVLSMDQQEKVLKAIHDKKVLTLENLCQKQTT